MPSPFPDFDPVSIWRAHLPRRFEVYPVRLPQRLPRILVPSLPIHYLPHFPDLLCHFSTLASATFTNRRSLRKVPCMDMEKD